MVLPKISKATLAADAKGMRNIRGFSETPSLSRREPSNV